MSNPKNIKLGTSNVSVNGTDIGYTSGGVSLTLTTNKRETVYDTFGTIVRNSIVTSITAAVSFTLFESQLENLKLIMTGNSSSGSSMSGTEGQKTVRLNVTISTPGVTYQFGHADDAGTPQSRSLDRRYRA